MSQPSFLLESTGISKHSNETVDCYRVLSMIYLILSIIVPSYIIWLWEIHLRVSYLSHLREDETLRHQSRMVGYAEIPERTKIFVLLTISAVAFWRISE